MSVTPRGPASDGKRPGPDGSRSGSGHRGGAGEGGQERDERERVEESHGVSAWVARWGEGLAVVFGDECD